MTDVSADAPGRGVLHTRALVRCASVTPRDEGALDYVQGVLEGLGFSCTRLPFQADGTDRIDNLFARLGTGKPHLCFAGHTDVVPPGDEARWTHAPFAAEIHDGVLYGRGTSDMKGGVAAFIAAVEDIVSEDGSDKNGLGGGSISFLITGDEEGPAVNGTKPVMEWMQANDHVPDLCLVGEPTNGDVLGEMIKIGRRGSLNGSLVINGVQGHVAYQHLAANPVRAITQVCHALHNLSLDNGTAHFLPSNLEVTSIDVGNPTVNVIPGEARAQFNIRYNDTHDAASLETLLRQTVETAIADVQQAGGAFEHTLTFKRSGDAFVTQPDETTQLMIEAIQAATGRVPELSTSGGTSDARFIKDMCPVFEFGLTNKTIHQVDECAKVSDIEMLTDIYRAFITVYLTR